MRTDERNFVCRRVDPEHFLRIARDAVNDRAREHTTEPAHAQQMNVVRPCRYLDICVDTHLRYMCAFVNVHVRACLCVRACVCL